MTGVSERLRGIFRRGEGAAAVVGEQELTAIDGARGVMHQPLNNSESPTEESLAATNNQLIDTMVEDESSREIEVEESGSQSAEKSDADLESQTKSESMEESKAAASAEDAPEDQPTYKLAKKYMKTPCNHSYHIICLKKWMDIRLECPTCRQGIPAPDDD